MAGTTWATDVDSKRPILGEKLDIPETTFIQVLEDAVKKAPDRPQYVLPDGTQYTLKQFYDVSRAVAKALISLGVEPLQAISILGGNALQWFAADVGAMLAAVLPVGIYVTNKADIVAYIVNHSDSRVFFVDGERALDKFLSVREKCPNIRKVVCWGAFDASKYAAHADYVSSWEDFLALGAAVPDDALQARMAVPHPQSVCKLIYTSGTTGPPKAVMVSHDNAAFTIKIVSRALRANASDRIVSFLPASHIAANAIDIMGALYNGSVVTFADENALRGSLVDTLKQVRPTVLIAVPRVYEKIKERMLAVGAQSGAVKQFIAKHAKDVGRAAANARETGTHMPWGYTVADKLVFSTVKKALGLDQCRLIVNAAAPLQKSTDDYFRSLDFTIFDLYGMSESTGPLTINYPDYKRGTSGKPFPGIELRVHNKDSRTGEGELCFRGRNMFVGYLGDAAETQQTMDADGYIHTGDLGRVDGEGYVTITGRAKELIITAGGENVAPALVESTLLSAMPAISRAFAIGDQKKFISAVLIPCMGEDGTLAGPAAAVNPAVTTGAAAQNDPVWQTYVNEGMAVANKEALSKAAAVKKVVLLGQDFSVETGELTPKMSVKRKVVIQKLQPIIEHIYHD